MGTPTQSKRYRFGLFEADPATGELLRQGVRVRVQDQPFRLLAILLERPGEVVSREEVRERLWPADTYVEFDGSLKATLKRLREALGDSAENPIFIETLPKRGYRFIAPVATEEEPDQAASTRALAEPQAPPRPAAPEAVAVPSSIANSYRRPLMYLVALVVLAGFVGYALRHRFQQPTAPSTSTAPSASMRKSVAVLGFYNASGRPQDGWLGTAFSEMLNTELGTGERLRLVPGEEVANLRISSPWPQTSALGRDTTARIGNALNSDVLILGSYTLIGQPNRGQLRLDVRLQDARSGEVLTQLAQTSNADDLFRVTSEIGAKLRERLGVPAINNTEQAGILASLPLDREGARFYALGIAKMREFDALAAKDLLEQAVKADPKFALAHVMLGSAWGMLGYEQKRKEEAKKALDLSIDLPRVERMQVEGDYYASLPDREKAASTYRAMFELFPDNVEYGLQLAYAQNLAGHRSQAMETIARLRRLPTPASDDPSIDLAEARILPSNRQDEALALRRKAATKASAQGKKLVYALARLGECLNLVYNDHPEQADAPCQEAYNIYLAAGNRLLAADALRMMADKAGGEGHLSQAIATYHRALKTLEGSGEQLKTAIILNNMAIAYTNEGNLNQGERFYRQAESHFEQGGDKRNAMESLTGIADILYLRGNLPASAKAYSQVIEAQAAMEVGDPGYALCRLADVQLAQGRVQDAHRLVTQALESARSRKTNLAEATAELGDILEAEGDLRGARQQLQASLEISQAKGRKLEVAEDQVPLAELALEEGHPDQAELSLRTAIAEFEKEKADPDATNAYTLLSRALLAEGKLEEARNAVEHAAELSHDSPDPARRLPITIQTARIDIAGSPESSKKATLVLAAQRLRSVIASARKFGYYEIECEARLALAEAEMKTDPPTGLSQSRMIEQETHQRGLSLLSNKAHLLITSSHLAMSSTLPSTAH